MTASEIQESDGRVSTAVRLPRDLHNALRECADERDVSVNFLVTRAVHHYLDQLPVADPLDEHASPRRRPS